MTANILGEAWNISQQGYDIITENNTIKDKSTILKNALNSDLKEIGSPILTKILNKDTISQVVLQIQKIRNVSAPKANEKSQTAPRMLKFTLTDGESYVQAIETTPISSANLDKTPPGSKILIQTAKVSSGYLVLTSNNCSLLGGEVPALYEKWQLAKSVQHHNRQNSSNDGPPAWVNFGSKIQSNIQDKPLKSLENKTQQESKENDKFEMQRQDAIAEAATGAVKKVFGGGAKLPVTSPVKRNEFQPKERKNNRIKTAPTIEVEERPQKPLERVSLFDFLEDKLPANETPEPKQPPTNQNSFYQNQQNNRNRSCYNKFEENHRAPTRRPRDDSGFYNNRQQGNRYEENQNRAPPRSKYERTNQRDDFGFYNNKQQGNKFEENQNWAPPRSKSEKTNNQRDDLGFYNNKQQANRFEENQNRTPSGVKTERANQRDEIGLSQNLEKMSLNSQFASRSLKQHLNLSAQKKGELLENVNVSSWRVGDECLAKYWEDGKLYNAIITAVTERTCVVKFKGYGNIEEVLKNDCLPLGNNENSRKTHSGPMEFRRSARSFRRQ